jgi:hypothetical protein
MLLRIAVSLALVCTFASAEEGPWGRFFNHSAVSTRQAEQMAMSKALSSVFNPLKLKDDHDNMPVFPELSASHLPILLAPGSPAMSTQPCSVPLQESKATGQFFITSVPQKSELDPGMLRAAPSAPCK